MSAWFYILRLKSGTLYPGATTSLDRRYQEHRCGEGCLTTKHDPPLRLVYHEEYPTFIEARRREAQVKRWSRQKKEALVSGHGNLLRKLSVSHDHKK